MTTKPTQHSVAIVNAIRTSINGTIDTLLDSLSVQSEQLEQAFLAELAHLDDTYTDQDNGTIPIDDALELVQRFDKGYAKTMASIQAATERLIEARAHLARITNTIEHHPAFTGNDVPKDGPGYIAAKGKVDTGTTVPEKFEYNIGPVTADGHHPVSWKALQSLINDVWPFSDTHRKWIVGKTLILSSFWQCPASGIDARMVMTLTSTFENWYIKVSELTAKIDGKTVDYQPVEMEIDDKIILSISPYHCFATEATTKENDHE